MLASYPCRSACSWHPSGARDDAGLPVFLCAGCSSEWVRGEPWAPVDVDGTRSPAVAAEVARRGARR